MFEVKVKDVTMLKTKNKNLAETLYQELLKKYDEKDVKLIYLGDN